MKLISTEKRPLITFALIAYNQECFIREAIEGAFSQSYSPLEIILSDDCSSDGTFGIMEEMVSSYAGPHRIILNRNAKNKGLIPHINKIFTMAAAEIVVLAAGDDISLPNRVADSWCAFAFQPEVLSVSMNYTGINAQSEIVPGRHMTFTEGKYTLDDYLKRKAKPICGPTVAYKKKIFEVFGPLGSQCVAEDATLIFRALLLGGCWHQPMLGAYYRKHSTNLSGSMDFSWADKIYRQNKKDLDCAKCKGLLDGYDTKRIECVMRDRLVRASVMANFKNYQFKLIIFIRSIMLTRRFSHDEKKEFFISALRQLIPNFVVHGIRGTK